jgi:hypothetical protein
MGGPIQLMAGVAMIETIKEFLDERQPEHTYA